LKTAPEILVDLVSIPSVSSMTNRPVIEYVLSYLDEQKWNIALYPYHDNAGTEKINFIARPRNVSERNTELALVCHTDTVPFESDWEEAVHPVVRDGKVYGRGSCDVKGFLACALEAFTRIDLLRLSKPLAIVLTADEEIGCIGAKHLASIGAIKSRYMIIGEPTGLAPVSAGKGYALAEIVVRGKEAHSAFPQEGHSAIRDAARILERLDSVQRALASRIDARFDPPFTTLNVGLIQGGTAKNIVPGECRLTLEWRPIPGQDPEWAASLIGQQLADLRSEVPGFTAEIERRRSDPPFASGGEHLTSLLETLTKRSSITVAFGTEASHLAPLASDVIVFGPGDMTLAHRTGEFVAVHEMQDCVAYLSAIIERVCGDQSKYS